MTNLPSTDTSNKSLTRDIFDVAHYYLGRRRVLFALAAIFIVGGVALNWGWLVAAGLAPIIIALLPCAVMCALGLCMHKVADGTYTAKRSGLADGTENRESEAADFIDPVSQRAVSPGTAIASVHLGQVYYFEDRVNRETFEAAPEKYLAVSQLVGHRIASSDKSGSPKGHGCCG